MKLRVYFDTSVFSAYYDNRAVERQRMTVQFWTKAGTFERASSELARQELSQTPDLTQRGRLLDLLKDFSLFPLTVEMEQLAQGYIGSHVFTPIMLNDALHVAAAVLSRHDILVSWNFKHLVNRERRARVNAVNVTRGLPTIEILAPPEM
ncbi:MAG: PIN domain-containing protein [Acidobacteria bacterium]|nr:PIN domain-containing protein [Acidobacteriota bacterium]MCI0723218.1 PIN domain-containing protein [Acidobacteriota bacterium]